MEITEINEIENIYREYMQNDKSDRIILSDLFIAIEKDPIVYERVFDKLKTENLQVLLQWSATWENFEELNKQIPSWENKQITLIDISESSVQEHLKLVRKSSFTHDFFVVNWNMLNTPFADWNFDLIINDCTINYNDTHEQNLQLLKWISKWLNKKGVCLLSIAVDKRFDDLSFWENQELFKWNLEKTVWDFNVLPLENSEKRKCWTVPYYENILKSNWFDFIQFDIEVWKKYFKEDFRISYRRFLIWKSNVNFYESFFKSSEFVISSYYSIPWVWNININPKVPFKCYIWINKTKTKKIAFNKIIFFDNFKNIFYNTTFEELNQKTSELTKFLESIDESFIKNNWYEINILSELQCWHWFSIIPTIWTLIVSWLYHLNNKIIDNNLKKEIINSSENPFNYEEEEKEKLINFWELPRELFTNSKLSFEYYIIFSWLQWYNSWKDNKISFYNLFKILFEKNKKYFDESLEIIPIGSKSYLIIVENSISKTTIKQTISDIKSTYPDSYIEYESSIWKSITDYWMNTEQDLSKKVFSKFLNKNSLLVDYWDKKEIINKEDISKINADILVDSIKNKVYVKWEKLSSGLVQSQKMLTEILVKLFDSKESFLTNNQLTASSYSQNKNEMSWKIIYTFNKVIEEKLNNNSFLTISWKIEDYVIKLEKNNFIVAIISKI